MKNKTNTSLGSHCARPELVEGFERSIILQQVQDERGRVQNEKKNVPYNLLKYHIFT